MPGCAMSFSESVVMAVLPAWRPSAREMVAAASYLSSGKPVRLREARARSMERSAMPASRTPLVRWHCEMLGLSMSILVGVSHMSL